MVNHEAAISPEFGHYDPYLAAKNLDPLDLDLHIAHLPRLNADGDTVTLLAATTYAVHNCENYTDEAMSIAALRDLDFLTSSLVKAGIEPIDHIPGLEICLTNLAERTGTVPRGSVFTYANANPSGLRQRTFTGSTAESIFIEAVGNTSEALNRAIYAYGSHGYKQGLSETNRALDVMINSILEVMKAVTPEFFTYELRPYFDSMSVNGRRYLGSGGAQLQLVGIDYLLWGVSDPDPDYQAFFQENHQYLTPRQRQSIQDALGVQQGMGVVDCLLSEPDPLAAQEALSVMRKIRKFRYPHRKIAADNFKLREQDAVGSGSYTPLILDALIQKNDLALDRLKVMYRG